MENSLHGTPDQFIVVHQKHVEHPLRSHGLGFSSWFRRFGRLRKGWEPHPHHCAQAGLALDVHLPLVGFHRVENHGEAEPGSLAHLLRGEEGIRGMIQNLLGHPASRIFHCHLNPVAVQVPGADGEGAILRHSIHGIDEEVHEGVAQGPGIPEDGVQFRFQIQVKVHLGQDSTFQKVGLFLEDGVHIQSAFFSRTLPSEAQKGFDH